MEVGVILRPHPEQKVSDVPKRIVWMALCGSALLVGLISFRYLLPQVPNPIGGTNLTLRRPWLVTHAISASVALIAGPWQFRNQTSGLRYRWHKWNGRVYVAAVAVGWVSSIPIAFHAQAGPFAQAGFLVLGLAWISTAVVAITAVLRGQIAAHKRWMVRSYALSAAAISLRILLPISMFAQVPFDKAYPVIAWSCWLVNLGIAEVILRRLPASLPKRISASSRLSASDAKEAR